YRSPYVVLALVEGSVSDPDGTRPFVAREVVQDLLFELRFPSDGVHDLEVGVGADDIGKEAEEVVRLPVETQGVQTPEHEGGVANPGVAVVPVPLATGR